MSALKLAARRAATMVGLVALVLSVIIGGSRPAAATHPYTVTVSNASATETNSGAPTVTFTITVVAPLVEEPVTISYETVDGTAVAGEDYVAASGTLEFTTTTAQRTVSVGILGDTVAEPTESFTLKATRVDGSSNAADELEGTGTISDNDGTPPSLAISDATVDENTATGKATFTVTRTGSNGRAATFSFATSSGGSGSATGGAGCTTGVDYITATGTKTIAADASSTTIEILLCNDSAEESNESFSVTLSNASNAAITDATGQGTIVDNDAKRPLSVADAAGPEGGNVVFTVTIPSAHEDDITANYAVTTPSGTTASNADFAGGTAPSGTVTIPKGQTSATITLNTAEDALVEGDETFTLTLSGQSSNARCDGGGDCAATGTIVDDEPVPTLGISDATVTEGGGSTTMTFVLVMSGARASNTTVTYKTTNGTATSPEDFVGTSSSGTTATINAGQTTANISVQIVGDTVAELDEYFYVDLLSAPGTTITDSRAVGTIGNDDGTPPSISIADATVTEGTEEEPATLEFTVTKTGSTPHTITANYTTVDATAKAGEDYEATSGTVTLAAHETSKKIAVPITHDVIDELNETFLVRLSESSNATISDNEATGTITDNDTASLSISDVTVTEGNAGTTNATFTVSLSVPSDRNATVDVATADGGATAPADYTATSVTDLTFTAGQTSKTFTVPVAGDTIDEPNETFTAVLSDATNATVTKGAGTATITDDDTSAISVNDITAGEGNSGTANATFTVTLSTANSRSVTVDYATENGTATAGSDYTATNGTLTFAAGETSKSVNVAVVGDTVDEPNETFSLRLANPTNATIADNLGTATVTDDDITNAGGDGGGGDGGFTIDEGYVLAGGDGRVYAFNVDHHGDLRDMRLNQPVIGLTMTPTGDGYWLVARDGGIFTFGDARFHGSMGNQKLNAAVLGMEATPSGEGYWLFGADGGIFTFGDARFFGSTGSTKLNAPMIGMEATPTGEGYWLVAQDGGIFTFGDAPFYGSTGSMKLNQPVFDMAADPFGDGYWLVARDGGIFTFGDIPFFGSAVGQATASVIGMRSTVFGDGYWIADANGRVMTFGEATYHGDNRTTGVSPPIVGFAPSAFVVE